MKKILVALAIATFASSAFATVAGSKHDFFASSTYGTGKPSRCVYCHVPRNAQSWTNAALWALPQTNLSALTFYSTGTTTLSMEMSVTCLSCHADGAIATSGLKVDIDTVNANVVLGPDFRNDHPIGTDAGFTPGTTRGFAAGPITLGYTTLANGVATTVECATCHNPHNSNIIPGSKLVNVPNGNASGDFCGACHTR